MIAGRRLPTCPGETRSLPVRNLILDLAAAASLASLIVAALLW
jgi:hypothetical protein